MVLGLGLGFQTLKIATDLGLKTNESYEA